INKAKEILAFEVTKLVHGEAAAQKAEDGAKAAFGGGGSMDNVPTTKMDAALFEGDGMGVVNLIKELGLVPSNSEGFRTIKQGGLTVAGKKVTDSKMNITTDLFEEGKLLIQKGKKTFHQVVL
ncbi:MAG: S4 domain-containing protein, partial [Anaerovoracaceae bacterium]